MSTSVNNYHDDGANRQVQAVLAMFQYILGDGIESSWNTTYKQYDAVINVARWENCREQGYVLSLKTPGRINQLNIAFYEHRNSDDICALMWEQFTLNSPNLDTLPDGLFENKWDTTFEVNCGQIEKMARWIHTQFEQFWINKTTDER